MKLVLSNAQDFNYEWGTAFGSLQYDRAEKLLVDSSGNVYATGHFEHVAVIGPPWNETTLYSNGNDDAYLLKFSPLGQLLWSFTLGGISDDKGLALAKDEQENIYLTGLFQGTADFDPSPSTELDITSVGSSDIFILKLHPSGSLIWVKTIGDYGGGSDPQIATGIAVDPTGNVFVTGIFEGIADFDPGAGIAEEEPVNDNFFDVFILKLTMDGNFIWVKTVGSNLDDQSNAIDIDSQGNVYIVGNYLSTADFDPDETATYMASAGAYYDIFILKLTSDGIFSWCRTYTGYIYSNHYGNDIDIDQNDDIYAVGQYTNFIDLNPSLPGGNLVTFGEGTDGYLLKLDSAGTYIWSNTIGGTLSSNIQSVNTDGDDDVYVAGYLMGELLSLPLVSDGFSDMLLLKYNPDGTLVGGFAIGGVSVDHARCVIADMDGNLYFFGDYESTFDTDPGLDSIGVDSEGDSDILLVKYSQPPTSPPVDTSSVGWVETENLYKIYPNPFLDYLTIFNPTSDHLKIFMHDASGKLIFATDAPSGETHLTMSEVTDGVYFITVIPFGASATRTKFIKCGIY